MKVTLIYPPDHRVPHSLYLSLPELAAALKRAGHEVTMRDLNAEVLNLLLDRDLLEGYREYMNTAHTLYREKASLTDAESIEKRLIENCLDLPLDLALAGGEASRTLNDPESFFDPKKYRLALDRLEASLAFLFGSIVGLSPYLPKYLVLMEQILSAPQNDPVTQALRSGLVASLLEGEPDLIGITMPYQENIMEGFRLASLIRGEDPHLPIVVGGPQITKYRDQLFADNTLFSFIDYAVVYEGATALVELVETLEGRRSPKEVRNLYFSERGRVYYNGTDGREDMDALPTPDYEGFDMGQYLKPAPIFSLMTSRGCCWKRCVFCSEAFHSRFAMRRPEKVFADVKELVERYGARHIFFWDSLMPPRTMRTLSEMIAAEGLKVCWFADTKFYDHYLRTDHVERLHKGGLRCLQFGLESANQRVLDLMRKGTKIEKVPGILKNLHDHGILSQISWFAGFPTETSKEFHDTVRFFEENKALINLNIFVGSFYFEFGTYLSRHPEEFDAEIVKAHGDYQLKPRSGMEADEIARYKKRYLDTSDMDLLCHGGYFLYYAERGLYPRLISKSRNRPFLDS